jgi:hypothetical protein
MNPKEQRIHLIPHCTRLQETTCPTDHQQECSSPISELPLLAQAEANKLLRFLDKVIGRLNIIVMEICNAYLQELRLCPENYDRLATYHVDLLARKIGKEVDALYQALCVSTIEHIELWVERQSLDTGRKEHQETPSAC